MTVLQLRLYPDPILREKTKEIDIEEIDSEEFKKFVNNLIETMYEFDGVGLAAPQVGVSKRVAVVSFRGELYVLINPRVIRVWNYQIGEEGCLSFPGVFEDVRRPEGAEVSYIDMNKQEKTIAAEGFLARAFLHEIDHLDGKLFIDYLSPVKRQLIKSKLRKRRR